MPKKTTKPPWVNSIRYAHSKVYVSELPPKGLPKVYYNIIGEQRWWLYNHTTNTWHDNINPAYVFAEYEVWFIVSDLDAYKCIGIDYAFHADSVVV